MEIERDWITEAGLRAICLVVRFEHRCGYVEVPLGHPLWGVAYNKETTAISFGDSEIFVGKKGPILCLTASVGAADGLLRRSPDIAFDVHGGLTYSNPGCHGYPVESDGWWFGFDCAHAWDPRIGEEGAPSQDYVIAECERLAAQIVEMFP